MTRTLLCALASWLASWLVLACPSVASAAAPDCPPPSVVPTAEQQQAWARSATDRGPLWRLTRDGRSSYLYGSLHVGRPEWSAPGPRLQAAWAETDALAVELDPQDVMPALAESPKPAPAAPDPALSRRLADQAKRQCLPEGVLQSLPPVMQLATLTLMDARRVGLDTGYGQDVLLLARARQEGRPVHALETVSEQLGAIEPEDPAQARAVLADGLRDLETSRQREPLQRLAAAWARSDLALLADYPRWCRCADTPQERAWLRRINDERNPALAERISKLHGSGSRLLIAVGALHMTGAQALPKLLKAQGFHIEQVVPARIQPPSASRKTP
ncbi:TraB/GumN family protein [Roseateles sp.]|uniref:TraB/GumN family protein n=1 Tax=Roseateles sp. TaxID=1971397 RepID=UPI00395CDEA9